MAFNKRVMAGLAAAAVLGVALSGCGGDTADGGSGGGDASGEPIEITYLHRLPDSDGMVQVGDLDRLPAPSAGFGRHGSGQ